MFNKINSFKSFNSIKDKNLNLDFIRQPQIKNRDVLSDVLEYHVIKNDLIVLNYLVTSSLFYRNQVSSELNDSVDIKESLFTSAVRERTQLSPNLSKTPSKNLPGNEVFTTDSEIAKQQDAQSQVDTLVVSSAEEMITFLNQTMGSISSLYPTAYPAFLSVVNTLHSLMSSLPSISEQQLKTLSSLPSTIHVLMGQQGLPVFFMSSYWNTVESTYSQIISNSKHLSASLSQQIYVAQNQNSLFSQLQKTVNQFVAFFSPGPYHNALTATDLSEILQAIIFTGNAFSSLTDAEQTIINNLFNFVAAQSYNDQGSYWSLAGIMAEVWGYHMTNVILAENPKISFTDFENMINQQIATYENSSLSLVKNMTTFFPYALKMISQGNSSFFAYYSNGQMFPSNSFYNPILLNPGYINNASNEVLAANQNAGIVFNEEAKPLIANNTTTLASVQAAALQLNNFLQTQVTNLNNARAVSLFYLPLPTAIATVLLTHYMPEEVDYLQTLSTNLYYSNTGSQVDGAVLESIGSFINCASFFNFASLVGQPVNANGDYSGDMTSVQNRLNAEIQQATNYTKTTNQAITVIDQQIANVQADTKLTALEQASLINGLNQRKMNLSIIIGNLAALQSDLQNIVISASSSKEKGLFQISGSTDNWQQQLQNVETALVSGSATNPDSGMFSMITNLQADQQSFADTGQNQQLELQLHLTTMQQEWTVIATSLQILNQIYLGLARNIIQ